MNIETNRALQELSQSSGGGINQSFTFDGSTLLLGTEVPNILLVAGGAMLVLVLLVSVLGGGGGRESGGFYIEDI